MSDGLPGSIREDVNEKELKAQLAEVSEQVAKLLRAQPHVLVAAEPGVSHASGRCFIVMPFNRDDLNVIYEDFVRPVLQHTPAVCALSAATISLARA